MRALGGWVFVAVLGGAGGDLRPEPLAPEEPRGAWVLGHPGVRRVAGAVRGPGRLDHGRDEGASGGLTGGGGRGCFRAPVRGGSP